MTPESFRAPELDAGLGWLNTDRPLLFGGELRGQVVVLDFWTYCCINCMHVLPDLAYLERKYRQEPVTFIGVHSAKFTNEASRETIRAAILRYEIKHPVVIDDNMTIWRNYAVRSWPTVVVVDSAGCVVRTAAGEGNREVIDRAVAEALRGGRENGTLAARPLTLRREASVRAASGLAFPGKVLADERAGRLCVADSTHNRIVIAEPADAMGRSRVIKVVGTGAAGADDGPADRATFNHPQGLAIGHGNVYVADTENHLIRAIDLSSFEVTTIVGTGEMSNDRAGGGMGTQQGVNSPWDLVLEGSTLYVAMAGLHQIWRIDLPVGFARALAGSGRENIVDGPNETAALAQPSGICLAGGRLYFADSEVSAIRGIDMAAERVFTVIGEGLFAFGDVDGEFPRARLQHPLGIDAWGPSLLIADTYNHKVKLVDPSARSVRTLYGTGKPAASTDDGGVAFFEPGGLSVAGDHVYVADTNNHRIVRISLKTHDASEPRVSARAVSLNAEGAQRDVASGQPGEYEWREIIFDGLYAPRIDQPPGAEIIVCSPVSIAPGRDVEVVVDIKLPSKTHLSPEAPWSVRVEADGKTLAQQTGKSDSLPLRLTVPAASALTGTTWHITAAFACCTESDESVCIPGQSSWSVPVNEGGGITRIPVRAALTAETGGM